MLRAFGSKNGWLRLVPLGLLPGCLVSFNDYPLGDTTGSGAKAGQASAGSAALGGSSSGSGGSSATAGDDAGGAPSYDGPATMIDDFEDGNREILQLQSRSGSWYAINDGQGKQTPGATMAVLPSPIQPARSASRRGLHTFGGPFQTWGALIGTSLASSGDEGIEYDLSNYQGVRLWLRLGSANATAKSVRLNFPSRVTNPGGGCTLCNDHFGADILLTSQWVQIDVPFDDLQQDGFGQPKPPNPDLIHVSGLQLLFPRAVTFDLWVDDIELY